MENAISVANFFISKGLADGVSVTPMKLVKLVYIAHGWHLGVTGLPLVDEEPQAWKHGPVLESVYHQFSDYVGAAIDKPATPPIFSLKKFPMLPNPALNEFLDGIWSNYHKYSGEELSALTHMNNTPWSEVWHKRGGKNQRGTIIPNDDIRLHYNKLAKENTRASIEQTLPVLFTEDMQKAFTDLQQQWAERQKYFTSVDRNNVMRCARKLLAVLQGFNPTHVFAKLTLEKGLYVRTEMSDDTTLQIEVLFDLEEGDLEDTLISQYYGSNELHSIDCAFHNVGNCLEEILTKAYA